MRLARVHVFVFSGFVVILLFLEWRFATTGLHLRLIKKKDKPEEIQPTLDARKAECQRYSNMANGKPTTQRFPDVVGIVVESTLNARKAEWQRYSNMSNGKTSNQRLPDVVGIGVKKCGTTALFKFLAHHPFVKVYKNMEAHFFDNNYKKGLDYYRNMMPAAADHQLVIEKTPGYFTAPPKTLPNRIAQDLPDVKLILVVCEPVKRVFSDYTHEKIMFQLINRGLDPEKYSTYDSYLDAYLDRVQLLLSGSEEEILDQHMEHYHKDRGYPILTSSMYSLHIHRWLELFDSERLLILNGEDLMRDPGSQLERVQEFLNIPKLLQTGDFVRNPETGLFCIRPWWEEYNYEKERQGAHDWYKQLKCLGGFAKGRTRRANASLDVSEEH